MTSSESTNYHALELVKHCRVCGKCFARGSRKYDKHTVTPKSLIESYYGVDIENDNSTIHPPEVCHACVSQMRHIKAAQGKANLCTDASLFAWTPHTDDPCKLCSHFQTYTMERHS